MNINMGGYCVVIVGCVLINLINCAPTDNKAEPLGPIKLLQNVCSSVANLDNIITSELCKKEQAPECLIGIDYTLRLCKFEGFAIKTNFTTNSPCPLELPTVAIKEFLNLNVTALLKNLAVNETCLKDCAGNNIQICNRLGDLSEQIAKFETPKLVTAVKPAVVKNENVHIQHPQHQQQHQIVTLKPIMERPLEKVEPKEIPNVVVKAKEIPNAEVKPKEMPKVEEKPEEMPNVGEMTKVEDKPEEIPNVEEMPNVEEKPEEIPNVEEKTESNRLADPELGFESESNNPSRPDDYANEDALESDINIAKPEVTVDKETRIEIADPFQETPDSHFFVYFLFFTCITVIGYIAFHNKNKLLALALEGRRGQQNRRRPNSARYQKLDLEEAIKSDPSRVSTPIF